MKPCISIILFLILIGKVSISCGEGNDIFYLSDSTTAVHKMLISKKYIRTIAKKTTRFRKRVERCKIQYVEKIEKSEKKVERALRKQNPKLADHFFKYSFSKNVADRKIIYSEKEEYYPSVDSLKNILSFIKENPQLHNEDVKESQIEKIEAELKQLEKLLKETGDIKTYASTRKVLFASGSKKNPTIVKSSLSFEKNSYYFNEQLKEYNNLFRKTNKVESDILKKLHYQTSFSKYLKKNSKISKIFSVPMVTDVTTPGVQTNKSVEENIQNNITQLGPNAKEIIAENMADMQKEMAKVKKFSSFSNGSSVSEIPSFMPNPLKTKRFVDRLCYSPEVQVNHKRGNSDASVKAGFGIAYKMTRKFYTGISFNYRIAVTGNLESIKLNKTAFSSSVFTDYNLKRIYFLHLSYENNITQAGIDPEKYLGTVTKDKYLLGGIKIKYPIKCKNYKATASLLYDFTHNQHINKQSPIVYKVGWEF
jgi:hypothetical protein